MEHDWYFIVVLEPAPGGSVLPRRLEATLERLAIKYSFEWLDLDSDAVLNEYVDYRRRPAMTRAQVEERLSAGRLC